MASIIGLRERLGRQLRRARFDTSAGYWEQRYARGGNSGAGSYNRLARFKADFLNAFVRENNIRSVVEFGSGDGAQLELAVYPDYVGIDVAPRAVELTQRRFAHDSTKRFFHSLEVPDGLSADLTLSLDVIYHLVEDQVFEAYMADLFDTSNRFVIVYSSNEEGEAPTPHVRHRRFSAWVDANRPCFTLKQKVANAFPFDSSDAENTSFADFYVFERA